MKELFFAVSNFRNSTICYLMFQLKNNDRIAEFLDFLDCNISARVSVSFLFI